MPTLYQCQWIQMLPYRKTRSQWETHAHHKPIRQQLANCCTQHMQHAPMYAVVTLAQFTKNPLPVHWTTVKQIYRYLKGTMDFVLTYGGRDQSWLPKLTQYVDTDGGTNPHQKFISGYVFTITGRAVVWSLKKQSTTPLLMAEAEYVAATHVTKQVLWHHYLFEELSFEQPEKSILWSDNQATIAISHNPKFHTRTKHININLHILRDHVEAGTLELKHIPSKENLADIFTMGLSRQLHQDLANKLGLLYVQGGALWRSIVVSEQ